MPTPCGLPLTLVLAAIAVPSSFCNDCAPPRDDALLLLQVAGVTVENVVAPIEADAVDAKRDVVVAETVIEEWGDPPSEEEIWEETHWQGPPGGRVWKRIQHARRHRRNREHRHDYSVTKLFLSAVRTEWFLFVAAFVTFVPLQRYLVNGPDTTKSHIVSLGVWLSLGALYNVLLLLHSGPKVAEMWLTGYLLELLFSFENVFVFHAVVRAFRTPYRLVKHVLFFVSLCQVAFELVFFMGLARHMRRWEFLPYLLGVWLVYVGIAAAWEGPEDPNEEKKQEDTWAFYLSQLCFGSRLQPEHTDDEGAWFRFKDGKTYVFLLVPATFWLLAMDFLLEIDVVLTKIEELPNHYISFTSSAVAAFAMVPLFFVSGDLFRKYVLLRYGVSFALLFFGAQMLLHRFVAISPFEACGAVLAVFLLCIVLSPLVEAKTSNSNDAIPGETREAREPALVEE